jgi:hypothetical protein
MFTWRYYSYLEIAASTYEVEYGLHGFELGTGTKITVNQPMCTNFTTIAGNTYDFYVRAYCVNTVGYGNFAGPYRYFAETNYNACQQPVNVTYTSTYVNNTNRNTQFIWNANGENRFEFTIVHRNVSVEEGTVTYTTNYQAAYYLNPYDDYDFYVRAICSNGNRTPWTKKEVNF